MAKSQIRQYIFTPGNANVGTIKIPGKFDLNQILLITNTTSNSIIYNFADSTYSGTTVSFTRASDATNFPTILDNADGYTTITLSANTSSMSSTDNIQILYEKTYTDVRMPEVGTDAFERTRVANPQSMLDADFEYGLQPTKWLTYDLLRGYPSIYEIPGTDQSVLTVTTDASTSSGGIGESLITVTINGTFGSTWSVGSPITVKGYLNTVLGFARAEGSFIINSVTSNTLTYYAKSKVGTNNGDVLSTTYTQLRQGAFYTGASIGSSNPTYTYTNPSTVGTSTASTIATASSTITGAITGTTLTTSGGTPAIGQVLSGGNITSGTYIVSGSGTTWTVSPTQVTPTSSTTITTTTNTLTIGGTITGTFAVGQIINGGGTLTSTTIIALGSGSGGSGTYFVNTAQTVSSSALVSTTASATITITFTNNHGFIPGDTVISQVSSDSPGNNNAIAQGPFFVETIPTLNSFTFTARTSGIITGTISGQIYARPDSFYQHRPFDGGVILGTGSPAYGSMAVRMSKKYIRYQSGKAINYNTGALFAPNYDIRSVSASGTTIGSTITITTDDVDHGCQVGASVTISGVTTSGYNGTYTVASIIDERNLTVTATQTLGNTTGVISDPCLLIVTNWYGATVRAGTFDEQNGTFYGFDGTNFYIGRRSSTFQTAGTVTVTTDSNLITGSNTRFASQLFAGDRVVIKGMTHVISQVVNDTTLYITPDYRGSTTSSGVKMVKTIDYIVPQSKFNVDRIDGSNGIYNPSGYKLDVTKMQMIGLQWTWYGAGFTDWMVRGPEGKYITVHRLRGNNLNREAYMRSGNQPVRYEIINESQNTYLTAGASSSDTTLTVNDTTYFPSTGTLYIDNEIISYTGKTLTTFTGCSRAATLTQFNAGLTRNFTAGAAASHSSNTGVILIGQTATPSISHWGSAFLTDGGFDSDRGYIFNYQATNISVSTKKTPAFAIRLAPSVSNALIGDLGVRELINRAQLLLQTIEITSGGGSTANSALVIEGILNPSNYPTNVNNITYNSLSSPALPTGQPSFSQIAAGTSVTFLGSNTLNTTTTGASVGATTIPVASTSGILVGDDVFSTSVTNAFQGATKVVSFVANTSITINNPLVTALVSTNNVQISRNTYALPGETVFSFVSSPANKDSLDLTPFKELTNTPIGGRGTFPNGPDVLFINVYLTQGSPILTNLVLRWGEAQA